jgi:hypothetical protein
VLDQLAQGAARFHHLRRQVVHFHITPIANHQPRFGIEQQHALRHVVERDVDLVLLFQQFGFGALSFGNADHRAWLRRARQPRAVDLAIDVAGILCQQTHQASKHSLTRKAAAELVQGCRLQPG